MVSKPTGRDVGRPKGSAPIIKNDLRYVLVFLEGAAKAWAPMTSKHEIAISLAAMMYGKVVDTPDNKASLAGDWRGLKFCGEPRKGDDTRYRSVFHPSGEALIRSSGRLMSLSAGDLNGQWFAAMSAAWAYCLGGAPFEYAFNKASFYCWDIGETRFFERAIRPITEHRFGRGPQPKLLLPEFLAV